MTEDQDTPSKTAPRPAAGTARAERVAAALRENLRRRKEQARARSERAPAIGTDDTDNEPR